jgi:hypothetical protein
MLLLVVDVVAENLILVSQPRTHCLTDYQQFRKTETEEETDFPSRGRCFSIRVRE